MTDPRYHFHQVAYEAITPIHVGSGQDVGIVDLPVIRERTTDYPFLPGSGIRGVLRDRCEHGDAALVRRLFGAEGEAEPSAGCVVVVDAHLVLFPVRSAPGVFRWITAPFVLRRWRSLREYFLGSPGTVQVPKTPPAEGTCAAPGSGRLFLEEYPFTRTTDVVWSWPAGLLGVPSEEVVLVGDADFLHFVRHATLVRQRNRLSTAKTVLTGHLFSVEAVPAEARFVGFIGATAERSAAEDNGGLGSQAAEQELRRLATGGIDGSVTHLTLGGDESVGMGLTRVVWEVAASAKEAAEKGVVA